MRNSIKSLPSPVAHVRNNFSDVLAQARAGQRIKVTRHGKNVAWIVGAADREALGKSRPSRSSRTRSGKR